ncbi:hypothetical protein LJC31_00385 [Synergistaceae bacterium OttesenSCG-928-I11]|nr:hypothetical protein [Synergistaceae bacterium OttesenSCG-928-I11]
MKQDTFAVEVYNCIHRRVVEIREYVDAICTKDFTLKYCLDVYKHLAALRAGLDFSKQCRDVESELEATICAMMESLGVSYEAYASGWRSALLALEEKASTRQGREELFRAMNDMMDFFDDRNAALHRIAHLQSRMARTAFQIERLRNGAGDVCVEEFIRRRESELLKSDGSFEASDE